MLGAALLVAALVGCSGPGGSGGTAGGATTSDTTTDSSTSGTTTVTGTGGGTPVIPSGFSCSGATVGLTADVVPITSQNCSTTSACHLAMASGNGVHDQLVDRVAEECTDIRMMVAPGDPEHSYVIHKLTGKNLCAPPSTMPLDKPMLSAKDIQTIYDWICQGAQDN